MKQSAMIAPCNPGDLRNNKTARGNLMQKTKMNKER